MRGKENLSSAWPPRATFLCRESLALLLLTRFSHGLIFRFTEARMRMTDKEQRRAWRSALLLEVTYEGAGVRAERRISDISVTGVYIETISPVPVGSNLKLTFTLPDGSTVNTAGVVVHSQPQTGIGVEFTDLKREDARRIRQFIRA
jgi:uncharacterized protein (TIGR02266 family)